MKIKNIFFINSSFNRNFFIKKIKNNNKKFKIIGNENYIEIVITDKAGFKTRINIPNGENINYREIYNTLKEDHPIWFK